MNRALALLLALLAPAAAQADGFVNFGIGAAWRELDRDPPFDPLELEYDTGTVARLELGTHYESGLQLRVAYSYAAYDEFTALGSLVIAEDIQHQDVRAGAFLATPRGTPLGWRVGGGYAYADESGSNDFGFWQRGAFVEAATLIEAGPRVTLDFAGALVKLGGPDDFDADVTELRAMAAFHTRMLDFTLGARYAVYDRERPVDEELLELRVGVGGGWKYPEGASY